MYYALKLAEGTTAFTVCSTDNERNASPNPGNTFLNCGGKKLSIRFGRIVRDHESSSLGILRVTKEGDNNSCCSGVLTLCQLLRQVLHIVSHLSLTATCMGNLRSTLY